VIYGGVDATGIVFDGVDEALRVPNTDIRLFGKPESFVKRRMGVALAFDADVEVARARMPSWRRPKSGRERPEAKNQVKWARTQRRWVIVRYE
jgi:hypothetical protein